MFHKYFRCTIGNYLRRLRLENSMRELTQSGKPITQVAVDAGFYDQSHFHRFFKRYTGLTPADARKYAKAIRA